MKPSQLSKAEENLEKLQQSLNFALEIDLSIGQLSRDFRGFINEERGSLAPANRSKDQTLNIYQMMTYGTLKKETKRLDLLRADLLRTNILMALEKTVGLPKNED